VIHKRSRFSFHVGERPSHPRRCSFKIGWIPKTYKSTIHVRLIVPVVMRVGRRHKMSSIGEGKVKFQPKGLRPVYIAWKVKRISSIHEDTSGKLSFDIPLTGRRLGANTT